MSSKTFRKFEPAVGTLNSEVRLPQGPTPYFLDKRAIYGLPKEPEVVLAMDIFKTFPKPKDGVDLLLWLMVSLGLHLSLVGIFYALFHFVFPAPNLWNELDQAVEISFGIPTDQESPPAPAPSKEAPVEMKATKSEQALPQLPKNIVIDAQSAPSQMIPKDLMPEITPQKTVKTSEKEVKKEQQLELKNPKSNLQVEQDLKDAKKMALQEVLRRAEKEKRAVSKKDQEATSKKGIVPDRKKIFSSIPDPSLSDPTLGQASADPTESLPSGSLDGTLNVSKAEDLYRTKVAGYMRRLWVTPEIQSFSPDLEVLVTITVNSFGNIISGPKIVKSSGEVTFDGLVLSIVTSSSPFPELPKDLYPSRSLKLRFTPKGIK